VILEKDFDELVAEIQSAEIKDRPALIEKALDQIDSDGSN
jgi:hypothetical protein